MEHGKKSKTSWPLVPGKKKKYLEVMVSVGSCWRGPLSAWAVAYRLLFLFK